MSIKAKNDDYYMYLFKMVDAEMINVDQDHFNDKEKMNSYLDILKQSMKEHKVENEKIDNMLSTFLEGYDFELIKNRKVICGLDSEYHAMLNFLSPYIIKQKHTSTFANTIRQGHVKIHQTCAMEVGFLIYDRICIKIPKKQAHLIKIKDNDLHEVLTNELSYTSIMRYIMKVKKNV